MNVQKKEALLGTSFSVETVFERVHVIPMSMEINLLKFLNVDVYAVVFHGSSLTGSFYDIQEGYVSV